MPSLVALIVVLVATAASARPAESPEWYAGLRSRAVCGAAMSATATPWRPELTTTQGTKRSRRTGRGTRSSTARCCPSPPPTGATMPAGATRRKTQLSLHHPARCSLTCPIGGFSSNHFRLSCSARWNACGAFVGRARAGAGLGIFQQPQTFRWCDPASCSRRKAWGVGSIGGAGRSQPE
jgi:hypothetical protein